MGIYPATPLHAERKPNLKKLQVIQNRAIKFILQPDTYHITAEELHRRAELEPPAGQNLNLSTKFCTLMQAKRGQPSRWAYLTCTPSCLLHLLTERRCC